jgi:HD-GYP domain-containing protein (c-di-GMP phosphodiesterase class II)
MDGSKRILHCGLSPECLGLVQGVFAKYQVDGIASVEEFSAFLEKEERPFYPLIVCGETGGIDPSEMAQGFRMQNADSKIYYISAVREKFQRNILMKNGFDDAFLLPTDESFLKKRLQDLHSFLEAGDGKIFKPVKVIDLQADDKMNFDISVYMPSTKRHIKYAASGEAMDEARVARLGKHKVTNMFVDSRDMQKFYEYTAERLRALGKDGSGIGATERGERLENAMRELFVGIFQSSDSDSTLQEGKEMMQSCKQIVDSYIMKGGETKDWYKSVIDVVGGERNLYSHASRVSTLASLFSIALQTGNPEDMATAGLFHDLGMGELPAELQEKPYEQMNADEKQLYSLHPAVSVKLLKMKKIVAPSIVYEAIEQHHEAFNGSGFPKGITPPKLKVESQILAMADKFDYLTCLDQAEGLTALKPQEALAQMETSGHFDPMMIAKLKKLFEEKSQS